MFDQMDLSEGFYDDDLELLQENDDKTRCLVFKSGDVTMFMSTDYITEIINGHSITHLPMTPDHVKGIINLRGMILPIVDIQMLMHQIETPFTEQTCIIVVNVDDVAVGMIVDQVLQVEDIDLEELKPLPKSNKKKLLNGITHLKDETVAMSFDCMALIQQS